MFIVYTKETMVGEAEPIASLDKSNMLVCLIVKLGTLLSYAVNHP